MQASLKSDNNNRYFTWRPINVFDHMSLISSQNEKCYRHICRGNKSTLLCSRRFFFRKSWRLRHNLKKYIVERGRPQMTIRRMRNACWITKSTHPHSQHVIFIAFPLQQWLYESALLLFCIYIYLSCSFIIMLVSVSVFVELLYSKWAIFPTLHIDECVWSIGGTTIDRGG
jgi:hypothetical protein